MRKASTAPTAAENNELRMRKNQKTFCTVAPLSCNRLNPNLVCGHLASWSTKCPNRGGNPEGTNTSSQITSLQTDKSRDFHSMTLTLNRVVKH